MALGRLETGRIAATIYRLLLRGLPARFRSRFADDMAADFAEMYGRLVAAHPIRGRIRGWYRALRDLAASLLREYGRSLRNGHRRASGAGVRRTAGARVPTVSNHVRHAVRALTARPGFAVAATLTLGLGIGANATLFSAVNALLLRDLPVRDPDQLVRLFNEESRQTLTGLFSRPVVDDLRAGNRAFVDLVGVARFDAVLELGSASELVTGEMVTATFFSMLGIDPTLGRGFLPQEDRTGDSHAVAVVSHELFQRLLGGDPTAVGRSIELNDRPFAIVGVAPEGFHGTNFAIGVDIWVPTMARGLVRGAGPEVARMLTDRETPWLQVIGRLKTGVSLAQANDDVTGIAERLAGSESDGRSVPRLYVLPERVGLLNPAMPQVVVLAGLLGMVVVGLVLLVACLNVAGLLLAQGAARRREFGIRLAVGAGRGDLIVQLLVESAVLMVPAGALGFVVAIWATAIFTAFLPPVEGLIVSFAPDATVLAFTLGITALAVVGTGLVPALRSTRVGVSGSLRSGSDGGGGRLALRDGLVVVQLALSVVILVVAGLFLRTMLWYQSVDPGYDVRNGLAVSLNLELGRYSDTRGRRFYDELLRRVRRLPGVRDATIARGVTAGGSAGMEILPTPGRGSRHSEESIGIGFNVVGTQYLRTMGIPLLGGRSFDGRDRADGVPVTIVNDFMARRHWPGEDPVGARIRIAGGGELEVVGVAGNAKYGALAEEARPYLYLPVTQRYRPQMLLLLRTRDEPRALLPVVRDVIRELDRSMPILDVFTFREFHAQDLWLSKTTAVLAVAVGVFGLLVSAIGLYGIVAFAVSRRVREIGIRMALGARGADVVRVVVGRSVWLIGIGAAGGVIAALPVAHLLGGLVYGVTPSEASTYGVVVLILGGVAALASYLPTRRVTRLHPAVALRQE